MFTVTADSYGGAALKQLRLAIQLGTPINVSDGSGGPAYCRLKVTGPLKLPLVETRKFPSVPLADGPRVKEGDCNEKPWPCAKTPVPSIMPNRISSVAILAPTIFMVRLRCSVDN